MKIEGEWYPQGSSRRYSAYIELNTQDTFSLYIEKNRAYEGDVHTLKIENRLGDTARAITLEDGSLFMSENNDAIDKFLKQKNLFYGLRYRLEKSLFFIFIALGLTFVLSFSFLKWGVPYISHLIAQSLPEKTNQLLGSNGLNFLDTYVFEKSKLSQIKQDEIRLHFKKNLLPLVENRNDKILFREWREHNQSIANAFALPSGEIIVTDKFVALCANQDEMDSVILHEMGHLVHRDSLEMLIESTFISVGVMMVLGDSSALGDLGVGLGSLFLSAGYSQKHEREADRYAFKKMLLLKKDPQNFSHIMQKIVASSKNIEDVKKSNFLDYFASHPSTKERLKLAHHYHKCFEKGLSLCVDKSD